MKKTTRSKKLTLDRATIRKLTDRQAHGVFGGKDASGASGMTDASGASGASGMHIEWSGIRNDWSGIKADG